MGTIYTPKHIYTNRYIQMAYSPKRSRFSSLSIILHWDLSQARRGQLAAIQRWCGHSLIPGRTVWASVPSALPLPVSFRHDPMRGQTVL